MIRGRIAAAAACAATAAGALGGCGDGDRAGVRSATAPRPAALVMTPPSARCGRPNLPSRPLRFRAPDGTMLDGALVGTGARGVVLVTDRGVNLCGWWPYATYLARRGVRVLLFDGRCSGRSACPAALRARGRGELDVVAAVRVLRRLGVQRVGIAGASYGGTLGLVAAARIRPPVDAVVSLAGPPSTFRHLGRGRRLDAGRAISRVTARVLLVVGRDDPRVSARDLRGLAQRAGGRIHRVMVVPSRPGHGWRLLTDDHGWSPLAGTVARFLSGAAAG